MFNCAFAAVRSGGLTLLDRRANSLYRQFLLQSGIQVYVVLCYSLSVCRHADMPCRL